MESRKSVGKIIGVSDLNVKVLLNDVQVKIKDVLYFKNKREKKRFEVIEIDSNVAVVVPFESVRGIRKGIDLYLEDGGLKIEYSDKILGKMFNSFGDTIDGNKIKSTKQKNVYDKNLTIKEIEISGDIMLTGIKVIDFFAPLQKEFVSYLLQSCLDKQLRLQLSYPSESNLEYQQAC